MAVDEIREPVAFVGAFAYEQTDIPPGQTLTESRRERTAQARAPEAARRAACRQRLRAMLTLRPAAARRRTLAQSVKAAR